MSKHEWTDDPAGRGWSILKTDGHVMGHALLCHDEKWQFGASGGFTAADDHREIARKLDELNGAKEPDPPVTGGGVSLGGMPPVFPLKAGPEPVPAPRLAVLERLAVWAGKDKKRTDHCHCEICEERNNLLADLAKTEGPTDA